MDKALNPIMKVIGNICGTLVLVEVSCQASPYCSLQRTKLGEMDDSFDRLSIQSTFHIY